MTHRIEIYPVHTDDIPDTRGKQLCASLSDEWKIEDIWVVDCYTLECNLSQEQLHVVAENVANPVSQRAYAKELIGTLPHIQTSFDYALEIGFLPGVTDNVAHTTRQIIEDALDKSFTDQEAVYSSTLYLIKAPSLNATDIQHIADRISNKLIQRQHIKDAKTYKQEGGMDTIVPRVHLQDAGVVTEVDLNVDDNILADIGTKGIRNEDGSVRGPLGLSLLYMQAIQSHFAELGRKPTDIELETLAQTWSEHCKHTIFADAIDDVKDGLYRHYIKRATQEIRTAKGKNDFCVSVFTDNSGAITFDDNWLVTDKAETHNSPSALDPFGGAITGIVGVNRDTIGFGRGAKPVLNRYGFCFADPKTNQTKLFKDKSLKTQMLSSTFIMNGVIHGVNVGGNCSGIPTPQGFVYYDDRYRGKPLVFAGTVGLIPRMIAGTPSHEKAAQAGDFIVMVGGRVGKDGIHGATFSSVALDEGSPATAVQIGDPITQKKFSDAIIKEARDLGLYHAITDNGAGGLSSSVGEMARDCGGFILDLDKVPLKYPGMSPWEIWISESQERMTLAIDEAHIEQFTDIMHKHDVEVSVIGTYTDSGQAVIRWHEEVIMDMSMEFLHDGLPKQQLVTKEVPIPHHQTLGPQEQQLPEILHPQQHTIQEALETLLASPNIRSREFVVTQYDHEVQASSVLKPLQGKGRVSSDAVVSRPVLSSPKGIVTSQGIVPRYSDIDTYNMAACSIDTAIRNAVAVGANPDHMAIMDNFCWCSSHQPERLYQLKEAVRACYETAVAFGTPFISGKDSMFNDFNGFDEQGNPVGISVPPTLLVSTLSVIPNIQCITDLSLKTPGDFIYIIGSLKGELGGSEYNRLCGKIGKQAPVVHTASALRRYRLMYRAMQEQLIASAMPVGLGGVAVALAKTAIAGNLGIKVTCESDIIEQKALLFGETQSCFVVSVAPQHKVAFEAVMDIDDPLLIGEVAFDGRVRINDAIDCDVKQLAEAYAG